MRLTEDLQEDIIEQFKVVYEKFSEFNDACYEFNNLCENDKELKFDGSYLYDFSKEELWERIKNVKEEILDRYYPIDYGDDEEDFTKAGERYRDSKEKREEIFNF